MDRWKVGGSLPSGGRIWCPTTKGGLQQPENRGGPPPEILYLNDLHGSFKRLAPAWFALRKELQQTGKPFLCLSGGDEHGGTSSWDIASPMGHDPSLPFAWQQVLGIHAAVPGNHDLDWGWDAYGRMLRTQPSIPRVLSHLRPDSPLAAAHPPVLLLEWPHHLMALLGALSIEHTTEGAEHLAPPEPALSSLIGALAPVVDSLVILSHLGWARRASAFCDPDLLPTLPDHGLLLGSHSHTCLPSDEHWTNKPYLQCAPNGGSLGRASWKNGSWTVRNIAIPARSGDAEEPNHAGWPPAARHLLQRRHSLELAAGTVTVAPHSYSTESPAKEGYLGECAHFNAVTDTLANLTDCQGPNLAALCVRAMTNKPITGTLTASQWYRRFGYADRCFVLTLPENTLWALLRENARRLLMPARFIESRGFLHFSADLCYSLYFDSKREPVIHDVNLRGTTLEADTSPRLEITTHAYAATGQGGFAEVFALCGIPFPGRPHPTHTGPVRDLLWHAFRRTPPEILARRFLLDGRLRRTEDKSGKSG